MSRPHKHRKVRRQHQHEQQAENFWTPPADNTENPDWLVGAN